MSAALKRIVSLKLLGVHDSEIATAMQISVEDLTVIFSSPEYRDALNEKLDEQEAVNGGWDSVESQAVKILNENLKINRDPKFALAVARVANQATRRGEKQAAPIHANQGNVIVLQLNQRFVDAIEKNRSSHSKTIEAKVVNVLPPAKTRNLLEGKDDMTLPQFTTKQ